MDQHLSLAPQTTLGSGNLADLLQRYCSNPGARFGVRLSSFVVEMVEKDFKLDTDQRLHNVLRATADDPVMRATQDFFFDQVYWLPAERIATQAGITTPLGVAVVYDSAVHGSWKMIRDRTMQSAGTIAGLGEKKWISAYVDERFNWLSTNSRADLRATTYRPEAFRRLIDKQFWGLELPLVLRGDEISTESLNAMPFGCYDGPAPGSRALSLQSPLARGLDVRLVQLGLSDRDADTKADGVFGQTSIKRVREFQAANGFPVTGVADTSLLRASSGKRFDASPTYMNACLVMRASCAAPQ